MEFIILSKYGFVYLWRDRKHNRFYIGSHWGSEDDGYICSSNWMRDAYRRRPHDFKRKILSRVYTSRTDTFKKEQEWLNLLKNEEIGKRYYNLHKIVGHWTMYPEQVKTVGEKISHIQKERFKATPMTQETKDKISESNKNFWQSEKSLDNRHIKSELALNHKPHLHRTSDSNQKLSESLKEHYKTHEMIPWNKNCPQDEKDRLGRMAREYVWITNDISQTKIHQNQTIPSGWRRGRLKINRQKVYP